MLEEDFKEEVNLEEKNNAADELAEEEIGEFYVMPKPGPEDALSSTMKERDMVPLIITINSVVTAIILLALTFYIF